MKINKKGQGAFNLLSAGMISLLIIVIVMMVFFKSNTSIMANEPTTALHTVLAEEITLLNDTWVAVSIQPVTSLGGLTYLGVPVGVLNYTTNLSNGAYKLLLNHSGFPAGLNNTVVNATYTYTLDQFTRLYNASLKSNDAVSQIGDFLPLIVIILVMVVILGLVAMFRLR